ncbi:MAG: hypothetical protein V1777_03330 [Candidatus Micrarchaeota archaeon]
MADKHQVLLDSVKKLVKLGVPDEEVILHLKEVGISEEESGRVLAEAKGLPVTVMSVPKSARGVLETVKQEMQEPVSPNAGSLEHRAFVSRSAVVAAKKQETVEKSGFDFSNAPTEFKRSAPLERPTANLGSLWESGLLQTVTDRLEEMKRLRDDLDKVLDSKVDAAVKKEVQKMESLFESQQILLKAKMNSAIDSKTREVTDLIDQKIAELKKMREEKSGQESAIVIKGEMMQQLFSNLSEQTQALKKQQKEELAEFNAELLKAQSRFEALISDSKQKLVALEERASKTLELETNIIEGLVADSQSRIEHLTIQKVDELASEVHQSLTEFEALKIQVNPEELMQKVREIEQAKLSLDSKMDAAVSQVSEDIEKRLNQEIRSRLQELDRQIELVQSKLDVKRTEKTVNQLEILKSELEKEFTRIKKIK